MQASRIQVTLLAVVAFVGLVILVWQIGQHYFTTDDAFISFRYARNLVEGHGLVFNVGERVEGYTNFLWVLLAALGMAIGLSPDAWANALSIAATGAVLGLTVGLLLRRCPPQGRLVAAGMALVYLCVNRSFAVWATGGLETRVFTLVVLAGILTSPLFTSNRRSLLVSSTLFGLAVLTRMEALLFFGVLSAIELFLLVRIRHWRVAEYSRWFAPVMLLAGGHLLFRLIFYGYPLPNTFYAKVTGANYDMGLQYLLSFVLEYQLWLLSPLLLAGLLLGTPLAGSLRKAALLFVPYLMYIAYIGGDHFEYRMLDPLLPFLALTLATGALSLWQRVAGRLARISVISATSLAMVFATITIPWVGAASMPKECTIISAPRVRVADYPILKYVPAFSSYCGYYSDRYRHLTRRMCAVRAEEHRMYADLITGQARTFNRYVGQGIIDSTASICLTGVGIIPYYTRLETIDWHGLTDLHVAHSGSLEASTNRSRRTAHEKVPEWDYLVSRRVDYIFSIKFGFFSQEYPRQWTRSGSYLIDLPDHYFVFRTTRDREEIVRRFRKYPIQYLTRDREMLRLN